MPLPLANRSIALAEGRQLEELAQMLEKEGASTLRYPLLSILDAPDESPVLAWLNRLTAGDFEWVVLMTGEGVRRLVGLADRHGLHDLVVAALGRTQTITRGPKPVKGFDHRGDRDHGNLGRDAFGDTRLDLPRVAQGRNRVLQSSHAAFQLEQQALQRLRFGVHGHYLIVLIFLSVGKLPGSANVTAPVAAHSVPRCSVAAKPTQRMALASCPIGVWKTRPLP